jgi:nucleoside-diphosphate-sugar epimerase
MRRILVTGALGQIGSELIPALSRQFGKQVVVASDIRQPAPDSQAAGTVFEHVDCTRPERILDVVKRHDVGVIYHLAALLSAVAETKPQAAWRINMGSLYDVLEIARQAGCAVFFPSSIGAFGPSTPHDRTPQVTVQRPNTMYGITKVAGELLCDYYAQRFEVDTRGLRLPGLISHVAPPGGGTTDYAVEMFYQALGDDRYICALGPETRLDMMYMPDAVRAMIELMEADPAKLTQRNAYNVTAMSFTPEELAHEICRHIPEFSVEYKIDPARQAIADSWPRSMDDETARRDWGWRPHYDLPKMAEDMFAHLRKRLKDRPQRISGGPHAP